MVALTWTVRPASSGQLRYWHSGAVVSGLPRLNEEGAEIVVTLDRSLDHRSTATFLCLKSKELTGTIACRCLVSLALSTGASREAPVDNACFSGILPFSGLGALA